MTKKINLGPPLTAEELLARIPMTPGLKAIIRGVERAKAAAKSPSRTKTAKARPRRPRRAASRAA